MTSAPKLDTMSVADAIDVQIYDAIVDAILNRQLASGTRLVEAPLCQAFGVTRGVLRRVFVKLAHDKVIAIQPNRGALVACHNLDEAREVFEARSMLEVATVHKLAQNAEQLDLSPLKKLVEQEAELRSTGQWAEWIKLSGEFHVQLSQVNQNAIISNYLQTLIARTSLLIGLYEQPKHNHCSVEEHRAILTAIEAGQVEHAMTLMQAHLADYAELLLDDQPKAKTVDLFTLFKSYT